MKRALLMTMVVSGLVACGDAENVDAVVEASGLHGTPGNAATSATSPTAEVTDEMLDDLIFLRQEEKLARDVYLTLSEFYQVGVFASIAQSEQTHMDTILKMLEKRNVADPVAGMGIGEFQDEHFVELYETLVLRGMQSQEAALGVGVAIEELDIEDITERLANNPPPDVARVYTALRDGSYNHLVAFTSLLD